jgi:hypothetical protein
VALTFQLVEDGTHQYLGDATVEHDTWWPMVGDVVPGTRWEVVGVIDQQPGEQAITLVVRPES